jgi:hypothetical protein
MPETPVRPRAKSDDRWERWVALGATHDDDARHRAKVIGILILSTIAVVIAVTLGLQ